MHENKPLLVSSQQKRCFQKMRSEVNKRSPYWKSSMYAYNRLIFFGDYPDFIKISLLFIFTDDEVV